jgi:hypothetical protein
MDWKPIETMIIDNPIWVLKYNMYEDPITREICDPSVVPGAIKYTSCHGWYESEADALRVLRHFPRPNTYSLEKVYQRKLLSESI